MKTIPLPLKMQSGVMLLEALIAIFIFSLGILALVGMQAIAAKQVTDAQYRSQASLLANQLFGAMWATDRSPATLRNTFASGEAAYSAEGGSSSGQAGPGYLEWKNKVQATLPVPSDAPPSVSVAADGTAVVVIRWRPPSEGADAPPHKYTAVAKIM